MSPTSEIVLSSPWYACSWRFPLFALFLGGCLGYFSQLPLYHTDLWGHLSYGRLIWDSGEISTTEPFLQQVDNIPMIDTAWLARWFGYGIELSFGAVGLQFMFSIILTITLGSFLLTHYKLTGQIWLALIGTALFLWLEWKQLLIIRPQLAGVMFYVWIWCRLQFRPTLDLIWTVPPIMLLWANLHGSFIMGTGLICCLTLGRALDLYRESRQFTRFWSDPEWRILMFCSVLAISTPLINPYGLGLYKNVLHFSENLNLYDLVEWRPLSLKMFQGKAAAVVSALMIGLWFFSPRKLKAAEILLLIVLGYATIKTSRMIIWLAPVLASQVVVHLNAIREKQRGQLADPSNEIKHQGYTFLGVCILLLAFLTTPFGQSFFQPIALRQSVSRGTPVEIARFINQQDHVGNLLNTMEWGDYLIWSSKGEQPVFVYSHVHLIPRKLWHDYLSIMRCRDGWEEKLNHYQIDTIAVENRSRRKKLISQLKSSEQWQAAYHDRLGYVFVRKPVIE